MLQKYLVSAPSNIALIKYMGKDDASLNLPANPSLSMTLNHLCTWVEIEFSPSSLGEMHWLPEMPTFEGELKFSEGQNPGSLSVDLGVLPPCVPQLSEAGVNRILKHAHRVRAAVFHVFPNYGLSVAEDLSLKIRTANTFPAASGIASSASSFAAVTLATALASSGDLESFRSVWKDKVTGPKFRQDLAQISRQGSGSSCRSFEGPWVFWEGAHASSVKSSLPELTDLVVLVSSDSKEVSSSQAHAMVLSSPFGKGGWSEFRAESMLSITPSNLGTLLKFLELHGLKCGKCIASFTPALRHLLTGSQRRFRC